MTDEIVKPEGRMDALASQPVPLDRRPAAVYLAGLSKTGRDSMHSKLSRAAGALGYDDPLTAPWPELRFQHVAAVKSKLQEEGLAPSTVNCVLAALKGVAKAAFNLGLMSAEDHERIRSVKSMRGSRELAGRLVKQDERKSLLRACAKDGSAAGVRDGAMLALLYGCGLRRSEVAAASLDDLTIEEDSGAGSLLVHGKGNQERTVYLSNNAVHWFVHWLECRGREPGALFCPVNKGGRIIVRPITPQAIRNAMRRRSAEAGVDDFSPHDLRRTFVSDLLDAGVDIATVKDMAGHSEIGTTARYDRRGEDRKRKAAGMLHVPFIAGPTDSPK